MPKAWNKANGGIPDTGLSALGYYLDFTDFYGNLWSIGTWHKIPLTFIVAFELCRESYAINIDRPLAAGKTEIQQYNETINRWTE